MSKMQLTQKVEIKNELGLHARPASIIARLLQKKKSKVHFTFRGQTVDARSIMSMLILAAPLGAEILISVEGEDAEGVLKEIVALFDNGFDERV